MVLSKRGITFYYVTESVTLERKYMNINRYGKIIERLRSEHGISQDTLANILLINTDALQAVEKGTAQLSDSQLNMCANIFDVSKFALENGEIRPRVKRAELQFNLDKLLEQYKEAVKSQSYMLETIQQAAPPERYEAKYSELQEYYIQGYFVYDTLTEDFVRDKDDFPIKYDTAKEALDAARQMDELYKNATQDKTVSADNENKDVNVTESVTQQEIASTINNLEYDDEGYLHFTVETDGYELEGLFRVNDPQNGKSMELVSIDYGYLHPEISKQWNQIEDHLKNEAVQYLEKQNIENNISEDYAETAFRM